MATKKQFRISKEVKDQVLKRIKEEGVSVPKAAEEHGISTHTIYRWLTNGVFANPSWSEVAKLKKENKALLELVGEITMKLSISQLPKKELMKNCSLNKTTFTKVARFSRTHLYYRCITAIASLKKTGKQNN